MITRRIVISACALSLAVPTTASAQQATHSPKPNAAYGMNTITYPNVVKARGPYGTTLATSPNLVKANGPYGTTVATSSLETTGATAHAAGAAGGDPTNSWRTAAYSEAALLATLALGSALLLLARRRPPRLEI
jgi:hypothetical protein